MLAVSRLPYRRSRHFGILALSTGALSGFRCLRSRLMADPQVDRSRGLVGLHGFTGDPGAWDNVIAALPRDIETTCPAIVGHDPEIPLIGRSFEDEVDRLAAALPRSRGPWHLAGYSLGGRLALGLLVRHRELFSSATLIGVHPGLATDRERRERVVVDEELARRIEEEGVERFVDHWQSLPLFESQRSLPAAALETQRTRRLAHDAEGLAFALRRLSTGRMPDYVSELPGLDLPIHLMAGASDSKFCHLAEAMASVLPRATVEIVPAVGHNLILEAPAAVAVGMSNRQGNRSPAR